MRDYVFIVIAASFLAAASSSFLSAFGPVAGRINLPLLLVIALVMNFREREAYAAAIAAGVVTDVLVAGPAGAYTGIWLILTLTVSLLFARVFTHLSLAAYTGINAVSFATFAVLGAAVAWTRSALGGSLQLPLPTAHALGVFVLSLVAQTAAALLLLGIARALRRAAAPFIIVRRQ